MRQDGKSATAVVHAYERKMALGRRSGGKESLLGRMDIKWSWAEREREREEEIKMGV